ncbi:MAG: transporter small permease [Frankiales bacterium]|jgi:TRAP-type C4-dicarboxylate transport system permease small subunit|nr:transporter small permease [Frankiales bacterium]
MDELEKHAIPEPVLDTITPSSKAEAVIFRINQALHFVAGFILMAMLALTMIDVVGRKFFDRPFTGTIELTEAGLVLVIYLAMGYAQHFDDHVTIDLLYEALPARGRRVLAVVAAVTAATIGLFLAWRLLLYSKLLSDSGYATPNWNIPLGVVAGIAGLGATTFVAAMIVTVWKTDAAHGPVSTAVQAEEQL